MVAKKPDTQTAHIVEILRCLGEFNFIMEPTLDFKVSRRCLERGSSEEEMKKSWKGVQRE